MAPFTRPWRSRNASLSWHSTSTSALPTPITSSSSGPRSATPRLLTVERKVLADQEIEPSPRRVRERRRARDDGVLEQPRALAHARSADGRDHAAKHVLRRRDVLHEVGDD